MLRKPAIPKLGNRLQTPRNWPENPPSLRRVLDEPNPMDANFLARLPIQNPPNCTIQGGKTGRFTTETEQLRLPPGHPHRLDGRAEPLFFVSKSLRIPGTSDGENKALRRSRRGLPNREGFGKTSRSIVAKARDNLLRPAQRAGRSEVRTFLAPAVSSNRVIERQGARGRRTQLQ